MTDLHTAAMKLALNAFSMIAGADNLDWIQHQAAQQAAALSQALAEQPAQQQPAWRTQGGIPRFKPQPAQQEPVLWQILNGVRHQGVRSTKQLAQRLAAGMQKTHDLGGSLAAFHVRPLYTRPQAREPLTDEQILAANYPDGEENGPTIAAPDFELICFARQIEAKLKEKNT